MQTALMNLIRSLSIIGIDAERVSVREDDANSDDGKDSIRDYKVEIQTAPGSTIKITVTDSYWRYPGMVCYFVNFNHTNGNFMACMGTPHIEQALFDLGQCFHMIPPIAAD